MNDTVATPRLAKSKRGTTIVQPPIRLGVIEMGDYADAKYFEKGLKRKCQRKVENVSPQSSKNVSLHKKPEKWLDYRQEIVDGAYTGRDPNEPHWWYWSGHHAGFGDGKYYAEENQVGFFNEQYYEAYKEYIYEGKDFPNANIPGAIFMVTGAMEADITGPVERQQSNPVFVSKSNQSTCVGIMLIGCNTLTYASTQSALFERFGDAPVVFGYWNAKAPGWTSGQNAHIRHILNAPDKTKPSFFEQPDLHFATNGGEDAVLARIVGKISRKTRKRRICAVYNSILYVPEYDWNRRRWFHKYGLTTLLRKQNANLAPGNDLRLCEVQGRSNPFTYEGEGDRFIVDCSKPNTLLCSKHLRFKDVSAIKGFEKIDSYLAYEVENATINMGSKPNEAKVKLIEINKKGTRVVIQSDKSTLYDRVKSGEARIGFNLEQDASNPEFYTVSV